MRDPDMTITSMIENGSEEVCHFEKFYEFACAQPEVYSTGPGYAISHPEHGVIYSDRRGWTLIWTRWVKKKLNDGWVFLPDGRVAAPKGHDDHDPGYWPLDYGI